MALRIARHYTELIKQAKSLEAEGDLEKAIHLFEEAIKQEPLEEYPYNRLMIIYRKFKDIKDELKVLHKAIKVFQKHYDKRPEKLIKNNPHAAQISKVLLKSIHGKNKAIDISYYPEPILKWLKRKISLEKKLS